MTVTLVLRHCTCDTNTATQTTVYRPIFNNTGNVLPEQAEVASWQLVVAVWHTTCSWKHTNKYGTAYYDMLEAFLKSLAACLAHLTARLGALLDIRLTPYNIIRQRTRLEQVTEHLTRSSSRHPAPHLPPDEGYGILPDQSTLTMPHVGITNA